MTRKPTDVALLWTTAHRPHASDGTTKRVPLSALNRYHKSSYGSVATELNQK